MPFFRMYQHLLPRTSTWRLSAGKALTKLFVGLSGFGSDLKEYIDSIWYDQFPATTRQLQTWENHFGLWGIGTESDRRASLDAAWKETGGQSPTYLQGILHTAGFPVYVHQWWDDGEFNQVQCGGQHNQCGDALSMCSGRLSMKLVRNPLDYTELPQISETQCGDPVALCGASFALCSDMLANHPGYLVNDTLNGSAPPPIPNDSDRWHYFVYWGGKIFPNRVEIPLARKHEFERLLLKTNPSRDWIVTLVDYV